MPGSIVWLEHGDAIGRNRGTLRAGSGWELRHPEPQLTVEPINRRPENKFSGGVAGLVSTCPFFSLQQGERPLILGGQKKT